MNQKIYWSYEKKVFDPFNGSIKLHNAVAQVLLCCFAAFNDTVDAFQALNDPVRHSIFLSFFSTHLIAAIKCNIQFIFFSLFFPLFLLSSFFCYYFCVSQIGLTKRESKYQPQLEMMIIIHLFFLLLLEEETNRKELKGGNKKERKRSWNGDKNRIILKLAHDLSPKFI